MQLTALLTALVGAAMVADAADFRRSPVHAAMERRQNRQGGNRQGNNNGGNNGNNGNNNNNNGGGGGLQLANNVVQKGSANNGNNPGSNQQAASATSNNNFINFCQGKTLTNGAQVRTGSCNGIPMGNIPSTTKMVSSVFINPQNGDNLPAKQDFDIQVQMINFAPGSFTNATTTYYSAPQDLNQQGVIIGHTHVTVQDTGRTLNPTQPLDPQKFAFFKGINDAGNGRGLLSAKVTGGLPAGNYRLCSMSSASNHQPVLMPVAQRGAQDDCVRFTVGGNGNGNNGNNNANNGQGNRGQQGNGQQGNGQQGNGQQGNGQQGNGNKGGLVNNGQVNNGGQGQANQGQGNRGQQGQNQNGQQGQNGRQGQGQQGQGQNGRQGQGQQGQAGQGQAGQGQAGQGQAGQGQAGQGQAGQGQAGQGQAGRQGQGQAGQQEQNGRQGQGQAGQQEQNGRQGQGQQGQQQGNEAGKGNLRNNGQVNSGNGNGNSAAKGGANKSAALGGVGAPEISQTNDKNRPFGVMGNSFTTKTEAVQRSCEMQRAACQNGVQSGAVKDVQMPACDSQMSQCISDLS